LRVILNKKKNAVVHIQ